MTWHACVAGGRGRRGPDRSSPTAALGAISEPAWPLVLVDDTGRTVTAADSLGPGGGGVAALLDALVADDVDLGRPTLEALARATPAGPVDLPLALVAVGEGAAAAESVDRSWLASVDGRRAAARSTLVAAGRGDALEAALHVAMLVATERFDPSDDEDVDAHVASGARLWVLTGAIVSVLASASASTAPDPFAAWAGLVAGGWWPIGPSGGRLVVSACGSAAAVTAPVVR